MLDELLKDLPRDLPTFLKRFGTDAQCRAYLVRARWPSGFRCTRCGHDQAYSHKQRLIEECTACGTQHSILAGTIFEQTRTGLARWFLAIDLVTSSKARKHRQPLRPPDPASRPTLPTTYREIVAERAT
jgi:Transposase zinc-ribbon domain